MSHDHINSYYSASMNPAPFRPALEGEHDCDVCVVGGGMTGTSAALHLAEKGYRVILLESNRISWGASGRSGGQMIIGYNQSYQDMIKMLGRDDAQKLWIMGEEAMDLARDTIAKHNIQCDLASGHYHVATKKRHVGELQEYVEDLESAGYKNCEFLDQAAIRTKIASDRYLAGVYDPRGGHLHPLNYTLGLASAAESSGAVIYENSRVTKITHGNSPQVFTDQGVVRCKHVALCANAYLEGLEQKIDKKIMPVGTYILATDPFSKAEAEELISGNAAVADILFVLNYYRFSGDRRLLFGGKVSYSGKDPADIGKAMQKTMLEYFPQLAQKKVEYAWGGNVAITVNRLPHFGKISSSTYFAHGFSGHGVVLTGLAGKLIAESIAGDAERFDVFARIPHQSFPGGKMMRTPALALATTYYRLRDLL
ncbi:FAD-binding oxidoreductase [Kiloniella laminariae]|uniref:FAD-binding oxidoreductase n=1 Tax=Kiloniella laminariae TaxID=454162 RepID=A0ABT4LNW4_9PROT|nr:FAD-binding oxidoreductase [Kiloniella laminariae]MCZ4282791.1 FAD-binding oxidoreductase [Kiloniella laminariae]